MSNHVSRGFRVNRKPKTLSDYVTEELKTAILTGAIKAGEVLSSDKAALLLDVSRMPVREAMCRLEAMGILEIKDGRGSMVRGISGERLTALFEARNLIEPRAAQYAAERRTDKQLSELWGILMMSKKHLEDGDMKNYVLANFNFHLKIAEISGNEFLTEAIERLLLLASVVWNQDANNPDLYSPANHEHDEIFECIKHRYGSAAMETMSAHLANNLKRTCKKPETMKSKG